MNDKIAYPGSLHNHTDYSNLRLRDSINKIDDIIDYAIELGHKVIAITEHETIANAVKIEKKYDAIKKAGHDLKVIRGNEIYLVRDGLTAENFDKTNDYYYHFILLAKDLEGHKQLREISTRAWTRSYIGNKMRRVPTYYSDLKEIIGENKGHIIASTACLGGYLPKQILKYKNTGEKKYFQNAIDWCKEMRKIFGDGNFYLEMQPSGSEEQIYVNKALLLISKELKIPYIITTDSHYLKKTDAKIHEAYLHSQDGEREVAKFYETTYMMDTEELESYLLYMSKEEIQTAYKNILKIAGSCEDYTIRKPLKIPRLKWQEPKTKEIPKHYFKEMPMFTTFERSEYDGDKILIRLIVDKLEKDKELQTKEIYDEINSNLDITWRSSIKNKTHWSAYFLNLQNIINTCWEAGSIVLPGRGSGVGFILLYILDITQINPLREKTRTYSWRFLNPDRESVLDIDFDISGLRRIDVLKAFRKEYGEDRVANVVTFGVEKSKSAILTAARGLDIDVDIAQYIASLIPADRGQIRTLSQCMYGDKENDFQPIAPFVKEMTENYPELWKVAKRIEGVICRTGIHAGGVIFVDEPFVESTALMRAPDGTIITQFDLHDSEDVSLIKYDTLSVEAADRIQTCLELLIKHNYVKPEKTLRETYEKVIGVYNLERTDRKMWEMVWQHRVLSLFQMEQQSGIQGIALTKPESVDDLATLNSVIRLMAQEKGGEQPINKYARFKQNPQLWYEEMDKYGLTKDEQKLLEPVVGISYGICESQERFMQLVQIPECGGFDLNFADKLRKAIAKKNPAAYDELEKIYFKTIEEKGLSKNLCNYVWRVLVATSRGYGFNLSHTLAYSIVALQELNLAYKFPIIFWNCACLIVDSGGDENIEKEKSNNYDKIAIAVNKIKRNTEISLLNINSSDYTFEPDVENNRIIFGLKGVSKVNPETIEKIKAGRPYISFKDFLLRCPLSKPIMINLIKAGAFDEIEKQLDTREKIMVYYLSTIAELKTKLNLQNFSALIQKELVPKSLELQVRVFNFNKYLKTNKKSGIYYTFDENCLSFYERFFSEQIDKIEIINGISCIEQKKWDNIYQAEMDTARDWIKENELSILKEFNQIKFKEIAKKYAEGNISKWEMDSVCLYKHEHELAKVNNVKYGIKTFSELDSQPVDYYWKKSGKQIPIFKISRIAGTIIAKNDAKSTVTLLGTDGQVFPVKFTKEYYSMFKKQISAVVNGKKKVIEKSWFSRGNMIMVQGYKNDNEFRVKTYKNTIGHQLYKITNVVDSDIILQHERVSVQGGFEEEEEYEI